LCLSDIQATFAGLRPIVDTRSGDPARASRDFGVWEESGLITVTGGKLTTFRAMAREVMKRIVPRSERMILVEPNGAGSQRHAQLTGGKGKLPERLRGMYGADGLAAIFAMPEREQESLLGGCSLAEIRWAARSEDVVHLDDLLFRRVRLGLIAPAGGAMLLDRIESLVCEELGWDAHRWERERATYLHLWQELYAVPARQPVLNAEPLPGTDLVSA
jgi:glycerol-3-phosphate dehydrogenase